MMRALATLAVLCGAVGIVSGLSLSQCTSSTASGTYSRGAVCQIYTAAADPITVSVSFDATQTARAVIYLWNADNVGSWSGFSLTDASGTAIALAAVGSAGGSPYAEYAAISAPSGTYTVTGPANTKFGITVRRYDQPTVPIQTVTAGSAFNFRFLPGVDEQGAGVNVRQYILSAPFILGRYAVQDASVTISQDDATFGVEASTVVTEPSLGTATTATAGTIPAVTATYMTVARPALRADNSFQPTLSVTIPVLSAPAHDIATLGPEIEGSVSFAATEYAALPSGSMTLTVADGATTYMTDMPLLFSTVAVTSSSSVATIAAAVDEVPTTPTATIADVEYTITDPTDVSSFQLASPTQSRFPSKVFVTVTPTEDVTFTVNVKSLEGECQSYLDCRVDSDEHPSPRAPLSANENVNRFTQCLLVPSATTPGTPTGRCVECLANCDCGAGQYCHMDAGVCDLTDTATNFYTCDSFSRDRLGVCIDKDPTGDIIGKACRNQFMVAQQSTSTAGATIRPPAVYSDGLDVATTQLTTLATYASGAVGIPLNDEGVRVDELTETGARFCGRAAYYNASSVDTFSGAVDGKANIALGARAILWQGFCSNGICQECMGDEFTCGGSQQCIDGKTAQTIVVDGTSRTFSSNTVAGTLLAAVLMIVLLQCCVCTRIIQEYRYRKADKKAQMEADGTAPKVMF